MNIRDELQTEYFELIRALNKTNRQLDQQTELSFFKRQDSDKTWFLACTVNNEFYLRVANRILSKNWLIGPAFPFQELAKYIMKNNDLSAADINLTIKYSLRRIFASELPDE